MQKIENNKYTDNFDEEIDLKKLFFVLVQGRWIITSASAFFLVVGIIYSLSLPNIFESKALLAPVQESSSLISRSSSQYNRLTSLAGITLPEEDNSSNSKKAIELMSSLSFFENHIMPNIFLPNLMAAESWDKEKNIVIYDESVFQKNLNIWVKDNLDSKQSTPSAQKSFRVFKDAHFSMYKDNKNGYIVLSIKHLSPVIAKEWVQIIFREVNSFYKQKDKEKSEKAVIFLNKQMAQSNLSEIKKVTASLLEKEIQRLTLVEANKDYVFEYIYPPSVMEEKAEPRRSVITILFFLFGFLLGLIIALIRYYLSEKKSSI